MPGPAPKPIGVRQRMNKTTTRATLPLEQKRRRIPSLPGNRAWNALTVAWWRDTWRSPMSAEFLPSDIHALYVLAELIEQFWKKPTALLAAEIRQQRQAFGQTPLDRRRLEWQVERVEATRTRRPAPDPTATPRSDDPRKLLAVV